MESIASRIIKIAEANQLNKSEFARRINVTPAYISKLSKQPDSVPSDRTISDVCREFNVNEEWLRTGEGEMFKPKSRNEELFEFVTNAIGKPTGIQAKLLSIMARLTDEQWEVLNDIANEMAKEAAEEGQKEKADP